MAIPTFNGQELFSRGAAETPGPVAVRIRTETMPGVDGEFLQGHGTGGREIRASGWLEATAATPAAAAAAVKALLRARQGMADGQTLAAYAGADGHEYPHCVLVSYEAAAEVRTCAAGGAFAAAVPAEAVLRQVAPA